jgi:hypothetical protein
MSSICRSGFDLPTRVEGVPRNASSAVGGCQLAIQWFIPHLPATGLADPFNGNFDEFRIAHVQRSDGWIEASWNNMSDPAAFAMAGAEEQEGGEPPPLAGAGVVVCLMR